MLLDSKNDGKNKKMKILVDGMPRNLGGIGTLLINFVKFNESAGNKNYLVFEFLVPENSAYINILQKEGYKYYEVPKVISARYRTVLHNVFKNNYYDYVWINNTSKVNIYLPQLAKMNGTKVILHSHGVSSEEVGIKRLFFSIIELIRGKKYCNLADICFACSKASAQYFYPKELQEKCEIISNGIETAKYRFNEQNRNLIRYDLNVKEDDALIGAVGRLTKVKNYEFLVKIMAELPDSYKLVILGEGEEKRKLLEMIKELNLESKVLLLGKKKNVEQYLSAMDIFAMPSLNEGMPFSLIEAQANGLRCLVSDGVAEETKITDEVKFLKLSDKQNWINELKKPLFDIRKRYISNEKVIAAGYSIENSYYTFTRYVKFTGD